MAEGQNIKRLGSIFQTMALCLAMLLPYFSIAQSMIFDHITIDQGLSNNTIYAIAQDTDGFMWFGSRDGLNRYDGYEFRIFISDPGDSLSLTSNNIQVLNARENGDLWIGLRTGGLCIFQRSSQSFLINPFRQLLDIDWGLTTIAAIFEDSFGNVWIGTAGQGVIRLSDNLSRAEHYASFFPGTSFYLPSDHCFSFAEEPGGDIWLGMSGETVYKFSRDEGKITSLESSQFPSLYSYRKSLLLKGSKLWIGTEGSGLHLYDIEKDVFSERLFPKSLIRDIAELQSGKLLISTDGEGLYLLDPVSLQWENIRFTAALHNSLNTNALYDLFVDSDQNVWIGSFNGGVNVYKTNKPEFYTYVPVTMSSQIPGTQSVLAFCEDNDRNIWIGMDGGGLWQFDPAQHSYTPFSFKGLKQSDISSNVVTSIYEDSRANLWIGTYAGGLNRIVKETGELTVYRFNSEDSTGLNNDNVWDILEDKKGYLWIATLGGGLDRFNYTEERFEHFTPDPANPNSLSDWNVRVLALDDKDHLWIGTEYGGINKLDPETGNFKHYGAEEVNPLGLQSNSILCMLITGNALWAGTEGGGLHKMSLTGEAMGNYSEDRGLPSHVVNAIREDKAGMLWLSTNRGISGFNTEKELFTNYDSHDGLASNQFNPNASIITDYGEMLFGNIRGVNGFIPENLSLNDNPPRLVFTDFTLFNESVPVGNFSGRKILTGPLNDSPTISLLHRENVFSIAFAALEYTNPPRNRYAYRMVGFEEAWNEVGAGQRKVSYTNLDPGEYQFEVKATNNSGLWSREIKSLRFEILPPFYARTWFKILIGILLLSGIAFLLFYWDWRRKEKHRAQLLFAEQEILKLRNEKLEQEVNRKNSELSAALLQSAHKNNALDDMKKQLSDLSGQIIEDGKNRHELNSLMRKIDIEISSADYWEQFQLNFEQIHQEFAQQLHAVHPKLSQNDLRLCCLMKINLTNREIASIQNISISGIEKSKYRLKKKLGLSGDSDLNQYILSLP